MSWKSWRGQEGEKRKTPWHSLTAFMEEAARSNTSFVLDLDDSPLSSYSLSVLFLFHILFSAIFIYILIRLVNLR